MTNPFCGPQPCHWECPPALLYCDSYCQPADLRTVPVTMDGWTDGASCTCTTLNDTFMLVQQSNPCLWEFPEFPDPGYFYPCGASLPYWWVRMELTWHPPGPYIGGSFPDPTKATLEFMLQWPFAIADTWIKQYAMSELPIDCKAPITLDRYVYNTQNNQCGNTGPLTVQVN